MEFSVRDSMKKERFNLEKCLKEDDGVALFTATFGPGCKVKLVDFVRWDRYVLGCFIENGSRYADASWFSEMYLERIKKPKEEWGMIRSDHHSEIFLEKEIYDSREEALNACKKLGWSFQPIKLNAEMDRKNGI